MHLDSKVCIEAVIYVRDEWHLTVQIVQTCVNNCFMEKLY
jgi:hypothetical protein